MSAHLEQVVALNYATTQLEATHALVTLATNLLRTIIHAMVSAVISQIHCLCNCLYGWWNIFKTLFLIIRSYNIAQSNTHCACIKYQHACVLYYHSSYTAIATVNDIATGEPFFTVPLLNISDSLNDPALCYEVEGKANRTINFLSDVCTSVNAYYSPGKNVGGSNVITQIGILAKGISNQCRRILVNASGCTAAVSDVLIK